MQTIALKPLRVVPRWQPASAPRLAQAPPPPVTTQPPPPPAPAPPPTIVVAPTTPKPAFIDSALVATLQSFTGAFVTGMLAYGATYPGRQDVKPSRWAYVFLAATAGLVVKGFADMSRIRQR